MATDLSSASGNNRILVVSGGGSRGAWGAGFAKYLTQRYGTYKTAFGTSTGSLMIPLIITNEFDRLEEGYTSVTQKDIFEKNPFKRTGELRLFYLLLRILFGKATVGETHNLRKLIAHFLTADVYEKIRNKDNGLLFGVTVVNFRNAQRAVKYSSEIEDVDEMRDWMWASANQPLFMTYYPGKDQGFYVDGGVYDTIPIMPALRYANDHPEVNEIDIIINQPKKPIIDTNNMPSTVVKGLWRLIELWKTEVADDDILIGLLTAHVLPTLLPEEEIKVNLHFFPTELYPENLHDLQFDKARMKKLWAVGAGGKAQAEEYGKPNRITVRKDVLKAFLAGVDPIQNEPGVKLIQPDKALS